MSEALKLGKRERKKIPTALELLLPGFGRFGFSYMFMESGGGSGSKLKIDAEKSFKRNLLTLYWSICNQKYLLLLKVTRL